MLSKIGIGVLLLLTALLFFIFLPQQVDAAASHRVMKGDTLWKLSQKYGTTVEALRSFNNLSGSTIYLGQALKIPVHTVEKGETMWLIAQKYDVALSELLAANSGVVPDDIYPGQSITIPASAGHNFSQQEIDLLARLVHAEASGEPYTGQVAVAASVLNRIESPIYPNTLPGVVYQVAYGYYQYSPVLDGRINLRPNQTSYRAVYDALAGWDPSGNALGFYNPRKTGNQWVRQQSVTTVIGNHVFFR